MTILGALMGFLLLSGGPMALSAPVLPAYAVTLTAYNAVPWQTDGNPLETASGAFSNPEVVAARSRDLADELPFGTIIEIDGADISSGSTCGFDVVEHRIGYRVIADTMNARYTNYIDILFSTKSNYILADGSVKNAGTILGVCKGITVRVVGHIDINRIPKTQAELSRIVRGIGNELAVK